MRSVISEMIKLILISLLVFFAATVKANDSIRQKRNLWPDHIKLQYAGGIGFLSLSTGYENRRKNLQADLYYGYVPERLGGVDIHIITGKLTWLPIRTKQWKQLHIRPLTTGLAISYTPGEQYFFVRPRELSYNYYKYPTALTLGVFIGGQVQLPVGKHSKAIGMYYELGSNERALSNFVLNNRTISVTEVFHLALGARLQLK
jgi:hypothetical protein